MHRIEVMAKDSIDKKSEGMLTKRPIKVYQIRDNLSEEELRKVSDLLTDPIAEVSLVDSPILKSLPPNGVVIEQSPKAGVMDPHGETVRKILSRTLSREISSVSYSQQYLWNGLLSHEEYLRLAKNLGNPLVNDFRRIDASDWNPNLGMEFHLPEIDLPRPDAFTYIDLEVDDAELKKISEERYLALDLASMKSIQSLFRNKVFIEGRKKVGLEAMATDGEIEAIGSSFSDHCNHNKFKGKWINTSVGEDNEAGIPEVVDNLLKTFIIEPSREIIKQRGKVKSAFEDNAGIIELNERWNLCHKVETHNHPSTEDGFGGAGTGVGGIERDKKHAGKGMKAISNQFSYRTAHPKSYSDLPLDIQTPARTLETVISGVEDYGNKMGIPTQLGTVMIDDGWLKPAVYVGGVGVQRVAINGRLTHIKEIKPGYFAISLGGRVGKDGIHGATGSSMSLDSHAEENSQVTQSVQIGNPIVQKDYFDVEEILENEDLIEASQDCGAGGWHSAVSEMAGLCHNLENDRYNIQKSFRENNITENSELEEKLKVASNIVDLNKIASPHSELLRIEVVSGEIFRRKSNGKGGVIMDLTNVNEKYKGLSGWEKLVSESQERGVIIIKPENLARVFEICNHFNVEATVLGTFNDSGYYQVRDQGKAIAFLPIEFLQRGIPQMKIKAHWKRPVFEEPNIKEADLTMDALNLLARPNIQSYNWINERYDHEVRGGSLIKQIVGRGRGKNDAIAYNPILTEKDVVIETWGSNPWQGDIDPYHMGRNNVVDAIGRVLAVGGNMENINFNGNTTCPPPEKDPLEAAKVLMMVKGASDAEKVFLSPTISGKDSNSMSRDYISTKTGKKVTVKAKPELLMSAVATIPDYSTLITSDFKLPGDRIFVVGENKDELGASEYYSMKGFVGNKAPKTDLESIAQRYKIFIKSTKKVLLHSAQYIGKGGLWTALANSGIGGDLGFVVTLDRLGNYENHTLLFSETTGRFVVTVHPSQVVRFRETTKGIYVEEIGDVTESKSVNVNYRGKNIISTDIDVMREKNKGEIKF